LYFSEQLQIILPISSDTQACQELIN